MLQNKKLNQKVDKEINDINLSKSKFTFLNTNIDVELEGQMLSSQDQIISATLDKVIAERIGWEGNEYMQSNEKLYSILGKSYGIFKAISGSSDSETVARKSFYRVVKAKGFNFKDTTHLMVQVVRVVFDSESRRTNKYASALRVAAENHIPVNDLKDFIYEFGGIEEVCRVKKENDAIPRHVKGTAVLYGSALATIEHESLLRNFNKTDYVDSVLFLGTYNEEDNNFDILRVIQNRSVIKAAFTSLSSKVSEDEFDALKEDLYEDETNI